MNDVRKIIKCELSQINEELNSVICEDGNIYNDIKHFINNNSKQIRSVFTLLYLKMNNVNITKEIISLLSAGEIVHNASLLHDDVIDNSEKRRGELTIAKKFNPHISVLMGDYLLSKAIMKIRKINNPVIIDNFLDCTKKMADAEIKQYLLRGKIPSKEEYIDICKGKTAYLFSTILECSCLISELKELKPKELGLKFGILFQIKNDMSKDSIISDRMNKINTAYNILGIEKTKYLADNYKKDIMNILSNYPKNKYRDGLEDLVNKL